MGHWWTLFEQNETNNMNLVICLIFTCMLAFQDTDWKGLMGNPEVIINHHVPIISPYITMCFWGLNPHTWRANIHVIANWQWLVYTCLYNQPTYQYYTILSSHVILYLIIWYIYIFFKKICILYHNDCHWDFSVLSIHTGYSYDILPYEPMFISSYTRYSDPFLSVSISIPIRH